MDADYSIELGGDDPVLDVPWTDPSGRLAHVDLKTHPESLLEVEEAAQYTELGEFLRSVNSAHSVFESAKCDAWATTELTPEEEVFAASHKFGSYVDVVFSDAADRLAFSQHEECVKRLVVLLRPAPEIASSAEVCVRRCFYGVDGGIREGFYFTLYVSGYGNDEAWARKNWAIAMKLVENAMTQLSIGASRG